MSFCSGSVSYPYLHSFPTRRSSDLLSVLARHVNINWHERETPAACVQTVKSLQRPAPERAVVTFEQEDRKSTRLNSSHVAISYAVVCLKKKKHLKVDVQALGCDFYA